VFILKVLKVLCFDTDLQVFILKVLSGPSFCRLLPSLSARRPRYFFKDIGDRAHRVEVPLQARIEPWDELRRSLGKGIVVWPSAGVRVRDWCSAREFFALCAGSAEISRARVRHCAQFIEKRMAWGTLGQLVGGTVEGQVAEIFARSRS
jgi:hypothetical protein